MAENIIKLRVDSSEYDQKLRRAAEGLQRYADGCRQVGGTLSVVEDETLAFVRAVGQMDTVSRSATGKLSEMKRTFTELASQYNQLTDEEKQSPFGKALAQSLDQLKTRINDSKGQLDDINKELNGGGGLSGALDAVAGKFGLNIGQLTKFGGAMAAVTGALKVAKDAFFQNETNVDDWGRTVRSAEGIYQSFLQSLNSSDFSDFLTSIGKVTQAARDAYNAIDELQTRQTILNPERAKLQARATELKATIRREGKDSAAGQKATQDLKALERPLTEAWKTEAKLNYNAFEKLVKERLAQGKINLDEKSFKALMNTFSSDKAYQVLKNHARGKIEYEYEEGGSYDEGRGRRVDNRNVNQKLLDLFTDEWRKANSGYLTASYNARGSAASVMLSDARYIREGGAGGSGGKGGGTTKAEVQAVSGSIDEQTKKVQELQKAWRAAADDDSRQKIKAEIEEQQYLLDRMTGKEKFDPTKIGPIADLTGRVPMPDFGVDMKRDKNGNWYDAMAPVAPSEIKFSDSLQNFMDYMEKLQVDDYKKRQSRDGLDDTKKVVSGLGQVASGLQQMGIELPKGVQQVLGMINGLMTVIEGVNTIIGVTQTTTLSANTAAMVALTSALYANTAVSAIPLFAHGGVVRAAVGYEVPGNHFSGDMVPALLNSGETVLNRAQSGILAAQLEGVSGSGGGMVRTVLSGEQCYLMIDRYARRTGKGEMVFWR